MPTGNSSMLELAQKTCELVGDEDPTGEFHPDREAVEAWMEPPDQSYDGRWRYVNLGPVEVRRRLAQEVDKSEREALQVAFEFWGSNDGYSGATQAGEPYRGEEREAAVVGSLKDCSGSERAEFVGPIGSMAAGGMGVSSGSWDIVDWDFLMALTEVDGIPEGDWYD